MTNYYANRAGFGKMVMPEGRPIDFIDLDCSIVELQPKLDVKGVMAASGGSL